MFIKINTLMILDLILWAAITYTIATTTGYQILSWSIYGLYIIVINGVVSGAKIEGLRVSLVRTQPEPEEPECPECGAIDCGYYDYKECGHPEFNEEEE